MKLRADRSQEAGVSSQGSRKDRKGSKDPKEKNFALLAGFARQESGVRRYAFPCNFNRAPDTASGFTTVHFKNNSG